MATILIADDEEITLECHSELLESRGHTVFTAINGEEAFELFKQHHKKLDLVITDLTMPVLCGCEFFKKAQEVSKDIPFCVITAHPDYHPKVKAILDLRVKHYFQKPASILSIVKEMFSKN